MYAAHGSGLSKISGDFPSVAATFRCPSAAEKLFSTIICYQKVSRSTRGTPCAAFAGLCLIRQQWMAWFLAMLRAWSGHNSEREHNDIDGRGTYGG